MFLFLLKFCSSGSGIVDCESLELREAPSVTAKSFGVAYRGSTIIWDETIRSEGRTWVSYTAGLRARRYVCAVDFNGDLLIKGFDEFQSGPASPSGSQGFIATSFNVLKAEEGIRFSPFYDKFGHPKVGVGHVCSYDRWADLKESCGSSSFTMSEVQELFKKDVTDLSTEMASHPMIQRAWDSCDDRRRAILVSIAFQLETNGLLRFNTTLSHMIEKNWSMAGSTMLDTPWARQNRIRARHYADVVETGECSFYDW